MAQVITKCPLTGHYKFMGMDVEAEQFAALPAITNGKNLHESSGEAFGEITL